MLNTSALSKLLFLLLSVIVLHPFIGAALALSLGILIGNIGRNIYTEAKRSKVAALILKVSVVGLGFGLNLNTAIETGKEGFFLTFASILITLGLGYLFTKLFKLDRSITTLISSGTAICGGSAIATISPIIKADTKTISMALGVVFVLNAMALFVFPHLGNWFEMNAYQFGMWCAIAIHDTSSVVGAASTFGAEALKIATTVKLTRALWIIPIALMFSFIHSKGKYQFKLPWYIVGFIVSMLLTEYVPLIQSIAPQVFNASKSLLKVALYLIGSSLTVQMIKGVGWKPMLFGIALWLVITLFGLVTVLFFL